MDTEGIEVLHVTNGDTVVLSITDNLVLDLLPALHTALNKNLGTGGESLVAELHELILVVGETTAEPTEGIGGTHDDGETNVLDGVHSLVNVVGRSRLGALLADGVHAAGKELTILGGDDSVNGGTKDLDTEGLELVLELDTDLEGSLSTKGDIDGIGTLVLDDLADEVGVDRKEVNLVGQTLGGLDSGDVGVDEDGVDALLLQGLDGLATRVIKLTSLTNAETTTAENKDLADRDARVESLVLLNGAAREVDGGLEELRLLGAVGHGVDENIEEELGVARTGSALGVELHTEVRLLSVVDTLVAAVVGVDEKLLPAVGQAVGIDGETVVLRSDVTLASDHAGARNVVASVTELHLLGGGTSSTGEELVTQADTKDGDLVLLEDGSDVLDGVLEDGGVTGTVGEEETIEFVNGAGNIVVPGADKDFDTTLEEAPQLVELHTDIEAQNTDSTP
ncbi:hypothetical protein HG531_010307 [Fusarium graminearum]|nr:hypothetical protein HG531_010307 [Fusarium graminearum]